MDVVEGESKRCVKCGKVKPLEAFYRKEGMRDGRLNKCIECTKRDHREGTVYLERHCAYCGADISRLNWKRTTCDSPECRERWQEELRRRKNEYEAGWRDGNREKAAKISQWKTGGRVFDERQEKKKGVRLCRICKDPILNGNWLFCETCYEMIKGSEVRLDGGYLFC